MIPRVPSEIMIELLGCSDNREISFLESLGVRMEFDKIFGVYRKESFELTLVVDTEDLQQWKINKPIIERNIPKANE